MNRSKIFFMILMAAGLQMVACESSDQEPAKDDVVCSQELPCADTAKQYCSSDGKCLDKKANGEGCQAPIECQSNFCNDQHVCAASGNNTVTGECSATQACTDKQKYCDVENAKCLPKKAEGATCSASPECISGVCNIQGQCSGGSSPDGQECSATKACDDAQKYCDVANSKCLPKKADGVACDKANECVSDKCNSKKVCGDEAVEPECSATKACEDAQKYCDIANSKCLPKKADGTSCDKANECVSNKCNSKKVCGDEPADPECSATKACTDAQKYCDISKGQCLLKKVNGEGCDSSDECVSGNCNSSKVCAYSSVEPECSATKACEDTQKYCNEDGQCVAKKADGTACDSASECVSDKCNSKKICGDENACSNNSHCDPVKESCDIPNHVCKRLTASEFNYKECETAGEVFCSSDNVLITCMSNETWGMMYTTDNCGSSKVCVETKVKTDETIAVCASTCETEGAPSTACDPNDDSYEIQLECKRLNGSLYNVPVGYEVCKYTYQTCSVAYGDDHCN